MANSSALEEQVNILTKQVNAINEFLNLGEEKEVKASEGLSPEDEKEFYETLALGTSRYGGGNDKDICQVTPIDHQ